MRRFVLFIAVVFIFSASPFAMRAPAVAATSDYVDQDFPDAMDKAKQESLRDMNAVGHVASVNTTMYSDFIRRTFGPIKGVTTNSDDQAYLQQMYRESFAYGAESVVRYVYQNPPANTYAFIHDVGQSLGFIPKSVHAQGIGFGGLTQLLPMWKAFRNIAYLLLAIFMIVIGFLIMFRKKIDPKTVITVQNALPNIIVTLLLITFSYAIVGVMIDLMYLVIMIAISILRPVSNGAINDQTAKEFIGSNFILVLTQLRYGTLQSWNDIAALFGSFKSIGTTVNIPQGVGLFVSLITGRILFDIAAGAVVSLLLLILIALAFFFAIIRILLLLISAYVQIIMSLLVSPFQLLLGVFPGSHAFEGWIKNLIANLAVFPITAIMLLIGTILTKASYTEKLWSPPLLATAGTGMIGGGMGGIIGLGILFAIPSVAGSIKEALKAKAPVGMGIGGAVGFAVSAGQQLVQYGLQKRFYDQSLSLARKNSGAQQKFMEQQATLGQKPK